MAAYAAYARGVRLPARLEVNRVELPYDSLRLADDADSLTEQEVCELLAVYELDGLEAGGRRRCGCPARERGRRTRPARLIHAACRSCYRTAGVSALSI